MDFAHGLAAVLKQSRMTQQVLADRVGVQVTQLRRYEAGTNQPTRDVLRALAVSLSVTTDSLVFGDTPAAPKPRTSASAWKPSTTSHPTNKHSSSP